MNINNRHSIPIVDTYSVKELEEIVKNSYSFRELSLKLGYKTGNGRNTGTIRNRLIKLNIDYSHFGSVVPVKKNK